MAGQDIREFLTSYEGGFDFLRAMKDRVERGLPLSPNMEAAVQRCIDREQRFAATVLAADKVETGIDLTVLPTGSTYHAVKNSEGTLTFLRIDHVKKAGSTWNGWVFVKHVIGGDREDRIGRQRPGQTYNGKMVGLLTKVLHNPTASMERYGKEIGRCGRCHRSLTDEISRVRGIGPECWKGMGG